MSDVSDPGALQAPDDAALFNEVTTGDPTPPPSDPSPSPPPPPEPVAPPAKPVDPAQPPAARAPGDPPEAMIPTARLREEAEARRAAERRSDALQEQINALMQRLPTPPQPQAPKRSDLFENPSAFVMEELQPVLEQLRQTHAEVIATREMFSQDKAIREYGLETVNAAYAAMVEGANNKDPEAKATWQRIMQTREPWTELVKWYNQRAVFSAVGGDISAYNKRILDQAMSDPAFQARVIEAARSGAQANGSTMAQPARAPNGQFAPAPSPSAPSLPSISRVGAAALSPNPEDSQDNVSDEQLFQETTTRRKR